MFELIVIWDTGEKEIDEYKTEQDARNAGEGYKMAFGRQIQWCGVRRKLNV